MAKSSVLLSTLIDLVQSGIIATDQQTIRQLQLLNEEYPGMLLQSLYDDDSVRAGKEVKLLLQTPVVMTMAARGNATRLDFDMCGDSDDGHRHDSRAAAAEDLEDDDNTDRESNIERSTQDSDDGDDKLEWDEVHNRLDDINESVTDLASTVSSSFLAMQIIGATSIVGLLLTLLSVWKQCTDPASPVAVCRA